MKKRTLWKMLVLEIITLGIYRLYYLIKTRREMMNLNPNIKIKSPLYLLAPVILIIAAVIVSIVALVGAYTSSNGCVNTNITYSYGTQLTSTNASSQQNCNSSSKAAPLFLLVIIYPLLFVAIILFVIWEWNYSRAIEIITDNKISFALSTVILLIVPDGLDILLIQDSFNKMTSSHTPTFEPSLAPVNPVSPVFQPPSSQLPASAQEPHSPDQPQTI